MSFERQQADFVYHLTPGDRLSSLNEGLRPNLNRGKQEDWRRLEKTLDELMPEWLAVRGISRAGSVYAHAEQSFVNEILRINSSSRDKAPVHLAALRIMVDPAEAIVCDAFPLSSHQQGRERAAKEYWDTAMTLEDYRNFYGIGINAWFHIARKDDAPSELPMTLVQPEVLVPGPIAPERIDWFASSAQAMSAHRYKGW